MIINNNNNNNFPQVENYFEKTSKNENNPIFDMPKVLNRQAMIKLSFTWGWSGIHFFVFHRPIRAILHLFFSIIGIIGIMSISFIILFANPTHFKLLLQIASLMTLGLIISIGVGIINAIYWSLKSDQDFDAIYKKNNEIEE